MLSFRGLPSFHLFEVTDVKCCTPFMVPPQFPPPLPNYANKTPREGNRDELEGGKDKDGKTKNKKQKEERNDTGKRRKIGVLRKN